MTTATLTPADLTITPRDRQFGRDEATPRWWHSNDPFATAFYNALSATFPDGEAFFVRSVRAFKDGVPDRLAADIKAFTTQEAIHSREHDAFNKRAIEAGYDIAPLEENVHDRLALLKDKPPIASLAVTMILEHFTAILAQALLEDPRHLEGADEASRELWKWHAAEEIEHKGVAYDTWLHATRDWSRFKRWKIKSALMVNVTGTFFKYRTKGMLDLLAQDGITGARARWGLFHYAFLKPGMVRKIIGPWLAFFLPGFHPWNEDDRHLIAEYEESGAHKFERNGRKVRRASAA